MAHKDFPYEEATSPFGKPVLMLRVIETDPYYAAHFAKIGLGRIVGIDTDGVIADDNNRGRPYVAGLRHASLTPYTRALMVIASAEKSGNEPEGSFDIAIRQIVFNQFDGTPLAERYMPDQPE